MALSYQSKMPVISTYAKQRIVSLHGDSLRPCDIVRALEQEGIEVKDTTVRKIIKVRKTTGSLKRKPGGGRKKKVCK